MENSNFKKLSNTLVDYFQRIQNEIDFKGDGFYSKYGRSIKLDLTKDSKLQDLFDALVANGSISPEPEDSAWVFEITDRIQLLDCAFLYIRFQENSAHTNYYHIDAITDGMKVISTAADHMKTIGTVLSYAKSVDYWTDSIKTLQNEMPIDSDLVHKAGTETISGQKTFTAKTTFGAETNFNLNTNFAGTAQFNGTIKNKKMVGGTINMHPEGDLTNMAYFMNDLTGMLSMGGTCTCTRTDKDGNVLGEPLSEYNRKQWFNGTTSYGNLVSGGKWQSATPANEPAFAVTDIVTIDIDFSAWKNFAWTTTGGLGFGSASWRAKDVKVETNYSENGTLSTWREVYNVTNSSEAIHNFLAPGPTGTSGEKCNRIRITLTNFNSASEVRIAGIWMIGYNSKALASTLLSRVDGTMMSNLNPEKNAVYYLGTSTKRWHEVNATYMKAAGNFQEGGIALQDKYGRLGVGNTWSAENIFTRKSGTKDYTDAEGNVIYTEDLYNNGIQAYYSNVAVKPTSITWWAGASKATDVQQVLPELSGIYATLPFGTHWHDQFAFCKKVTPTYETTTDGSIWTTATLDKRLFNQKMSQAVSVITDTICGSRWTWNMTSDDLKNGNGEWLVIGRSWSSAWPDMRILIEYKENADASWTTLTDVTYPAGKGAITPLFIRPYTGYMTNHDQLRITLSKKPGSTGTQSISAMKMLTNRWGGQGYGTELQYPYDWDENQNVSFNGNLITTNNLDVTGILDVSGDAILGNVSINKLNTENTRISYVVFTPEDIENIDYNQTFIGDEQGRTIIIDYLELATRSGMLPLIKLQPNQKVILVNYQESLLDEQMNHEQQIECTQSLPLYEGFGVEVQGNGLGCVMLEGLSDNSIWVSPTDFTNGNSIIIEAVNDFRGAYWSVKKAFIGEV